MSDESGREKAVKRGSFGNAKSKSVKSHTCDDEPQTSETSNLVSACSSHTFYSENADGKGVVRGGVISSSCLYDGSKIMTSEEQVDGNNDSGCSRSGVTPGVHSLHGLVNESFNHVCLSNLQPTKAHSAVKLDSAEKTRTPTDFGGSSHTRCITRSSRRLGGIESVDTSNDVQSSPKVLGGETSGKDGSVSNSASESNSSQSNSTSRCTRTSSAKHHENATNGHVCTSSSYEIKETKFHPSSPDKVDSRRCGGGSNFEEEPMYMEKNGGSSLVSKQVVAKTSNGLEKMSSLCSTQFVNQSGRSPGVIDVPRKHGEYEDLSGSLPDKSLNMDSMGTASTVLLASKEPHIKTAPVAQNLASVSKNAGELIESAVVQVASSSIVFPVIASGTSGTTSSFKDSLISSVGSATKIHPYAEAEHGQDPNTANISTDRNNTAGLSSKPKPKAVPVNGHFEGCTTSSGASEKQGNLQLSQHSSESDHSDSDLVEDDVKVCDICGDAGREEQLAVCSRCNDGAEHTYCMQVMLDKVPEGEWLCELCKSKENVGNQKSDKCESTVSASRLPILNEKNKISKASAISKSLPKLDLKVLDLDMKQTTKPATPKLVEAEPVPATKRQASDRGNGLPNLCSPNRKSSLLREGSFKNLDTGKVKLVPSVTSSVGQSAKHREEIVTYGCNSRMQSRLQSPRNKFSSPSNLPHKPAQLSDGGNCSSPSSTLVSKASTLLKDSEASLSKTTTSQGVKPKPKVKQVLGEVPPKQLLARNHSFCDRRKEEPVKMLGKSSSFKSNTNTVSLSLDDMKSKLQSQNSSRAEDLKTLKQLNEGASLTGRKNSFKLDHPTNGSSLAASTGNLHLPKADTKALQSGTKTKSGSDMAVSSKNAEKATAHGNGNRKRLLSGHGEYVEPKSNELDKKNGLVDEKPKNLNSVAVDTSVGSENLVVSAGSQVQIQTPSFDDTSAVASSSQLKMMEQSLQQDASKEDNLIGSHVPDKSHSNLSCTVQEGLLQTTDLSNLETKSKELSSCVQSRKLLANGRKIRCFRCKEIGHIAQFCPNRGNDAGISPRASTASAVRSSKEITEKSKLDHVVETVLSQKTKNVEGDRPFILSNDVASPAIDLNSDLASKTPVSTGLGVVSAVTDSGGVLSLDKDGQTLEPCFREMPFQLFRSRAACSVIPEHNYIWQGDFEVQRSGKIADFCDGVQAHLSTCASPKVIEAANGFPSRVQLEEISRLSLWPVQFQAKYPTEDNIALYFFAKDAESYERHYKKLVENMLANDLALKANVNGVELLIFTSNQLPDNSQRWNRLFFLWGIFRERKVDCLEPANSSVEKPFGVDRDVASSSKDFFSMVAETTVVSNLIPPVFLGEDLFSYRTSEASEAAKAVTSMPMGFPSSVDQSSNSFGHNQSIKDVLPSKKQSSSIAPDINSNSQQMACQLSGNSPCKVPQNSRQKQSGISLKEGYRDSQIRKDMDQSWLQQSKMLNVAESSRAFPVVSEMQEALSDSSKDTKVVSSNQDQEKLTKEIQMVAKGKNGAVQDNFDKSKIQFLVDLGGQEPAIVPIKKENSALDLRSNCKRQHVCISEKTLKAGEIKDEGTTNGEHESKRIKRSSILNSSDGFSRGIDLNSSFLENEEMNHTFDHVEAAESSKTAERYFFSVEFAHAHELEAISSNSCPGFKNNNDDPPNLELALGAGKQVRKGLPPLFLNVLEERSCKDSHSDKGIDGGASSLSLSLAFPVPEKEKPENSDPASEKVFAEQTHVNTSLWLFGSCMDS